MADAELAALTEDTAPAVDDWLYKVDNAGNTDRKVKVGNARRSPATRLVLALNCR